MMKNQRLLQVILSLSLSLSLNKAQFSFYRRNCAVTDQAWWRREAAGGIKRESLFTGFTQKRKLSLKILFIIETEVQAVGKIDFHWTISTDEVYEVEPMQCMHLFEDFGTPLPFSCRILYWFKQVLHLSITITHDRIKIKKCG